MAINYLNSIDLNQNELIHGTIENQASDALAGTPVEGQLYFNTTSKALKVGKEILPATDPKTYEWVEIGNYSGWTLDGDSGTGEVISSGDTAMFAGGLKITTDVASGDILNIVHDLQAQADSANTATPGYGDTFTVIDTVTRDTTGHVTGVNVKTVTIPVSDNTDTTYDLSKAAASGDLVLSANGTAQDTISFAGTASQIEIDVATEDSYTFKFPTAGVVLPDGSTATTQATGDNSTKVATTAFVQASVTGLLEFKGGFNANTGAIVGGGNLTTGATRVAVSVGDYYVVTVDGDFFGNAATPLTVGDSVIVQTAAAAGASVEGNFIVVQSDTDLATASTVGLGNVAPGEAIDVSYSAGTATVSVEDSSPTNKGAVSLEGSSGIAISYTNGHAIIYRDSSILNAVRRSLDTSVTGNPGSVTRTVSGGITTFTLNTGSMGLGAASALDVKAEVISAAGQTVYADITRSGNVISIAFTGTVNNGDYQVLLSATKFVA